jgi:hypothetical protein
MAVLAAETSTQEATAA